MLNQNSEVRSRMTFIRNVDGIYDLIKENESIYTSLANELLIHRNKI